MELKNLRTAYQLANPFPHIVIDEFMSEFDAMFISKEMDNYTMWGSDGSEYSKHAQVNKFFTPWCDDNIEDIKRDMPLTWKYLQYYNSPEFLRQLEDLTGIKGLIADDLYEGGGVHKIESGGKLSIHTDYSKHPRKDLYRRINLLIYLNEDWDPNWGGSLQLWNNDTKELVSEVQPMMNRAVIFNTTSTSLHGHPHPLNTPQGIARKSIALYYFTEESGEDAETVAATWYDLE
jgi:Rps23 Pro-64 3,4-dihydroxylase Tpa1-like proline 4-hydroxylase